MSYDAAPAGSSVVRGDDAGKTYSPNLTCDCEDLFGGFDVESWQVGWRRRAHDLCLSQGQWYEGGPAQLGTTAAQSLGESTAGGQRSGEECRGEQDRRSQVLASPSPGPGTGCLCQPSTPTSRQSR
jgi:hypothetical protein